VKLNSLRRRCKPRKLGKSFYINTIVRPRNHGDNRACHTDRCQMYRSAATSGPAFAEDNLSASCPPE
jgi:hypothetical protein